MRYFEHKNVESYEEASARLREAGGQAVPMAGGTDLLGVLKDRILPDYPKTVINLKTIPDSDTICEEDGMLVLGAGARLSQIAASPLVRQKAPALAEAAGMVASPILRSLGTIGGNLCQDVRCWYYRYPERAGKALPCKRKGGSLCYAIQGENRYHSVYGGMECGSSACSSACPSGTDIPGYMAKLREGDWDGAARVLLRYNPMPAITARICPHPCQDSCSQTQYGDSVNIHGVEGSLGDYILEHADIFYPAPRTESRRKVAVIGSGPSGLAAAFYLRQNGHAVTVYDRMEQAGGVLRYGIPHYRLPRTVIDRFVDALKGMGIEFRMGVEIGTDLAVKELESSYDRLYLATGAWKQPVLGLAGEELTAFGLDFLMEVNTYLKKSLDGSVLVCGGGNVAMDVALTAVRLGARQVRLICLEKEEEMPASAEEVARAQEEGVEILNGWGLEQVLTDENGKVRGLKVKQCVSVYDGEHGFSPVYDENVVQEIPADTIVLATGQKVELGFLGEALEAQLKTAHGLIRADRESHQTASPHIFAGGDAVNGPGLAIQAIRAGRLAAAGIERDLGGTIARGKEPDGFRQMNPREIYNHRAHRQQERPPKERTLTLEDCISLDREEAAAEARRCMNCGCYSVGSSDLAPVLVMMDAHILTTERTLPAARLLTSRLRIQDVLEPGELVCAIRIPACQGMSHYDKKRVRDAVDFAIVSLASALEVQERKIKRATLVLGGVAPVPVRLKEAERYLEGRKVCMETAQEAVSIALRNAAPMDKNAYKLVFIQELIQNAILRVME